MAILPATMHPGGWANENYGSIGPYVNNIHDIRHYDTSAPHMPSPHLLHQYIQQRGIPTSTYIKPWVQIGNNTNVVSTIKAEQDQFHAVLDMMHFMPDEITVKVVDKFVVVEGEHTEKQDEHGWISRRFSRKYLVPEQYDHEQVNSSLSSDGVLTITAPRKYDPKYHHEKHLKIEITGKPVAREILVAKEEEKI